MADALGSVDGTFYRSGPHYRESRCISHGLLAEEAADASG
jgi:hypothetical protein